MSFVTNKKSKTISLIFGVVVLVATLAYFLSSKFIGYNSKASSFDLPKAETFISDSSFATDPVFEDVNPSSASYPYIKSLYLNKISAGCSSEPLKFCPNDPFTRANAAILVIRSKFGAGFIPPQPPTQRFVDVSKDHYAYSWIGKLARIGATVGCTQTRYCPADMTTRAEMAVFIVKALKGGSFVPKYNPVFSDVPESHWAAPWISELYKLGITSGCSQGKYCPEDDITRAEAAVFLVRAFKLPM